MSSSTCGCTPKAESTTSFYSTDGFYPGYIGTWTGTTWSTVGFMSNSEKDSFMNTLIRICEGRYNPDPNDKTHYLSPAERKIVQDKLIELVQSISVS